MRTALFQSSGHPGRVVENLKVLDHAAAPPAPGGGDPLGSNQLRRNP
ncbi:hypothetical protein ACFWHF_04665 [Streptomyces griseoincarnatus]